MLFMSIALSVGRVLMQTQASERLQDKRVEKLCRFGSIKGLEPTARKQRIRGCTGLFTPDPKIEGLAFRLRFRV